MAVEARRCSASPPLQLTAFVHRLSPWQRTSPNSATIFLGCEPGCRSWRLRCCVATVRLNSCPVGCLVLAFLQWFTANGGALLSNYLTASPPSRFLPVETQISKRDKENGPKTKMKWLVASPVSLIHCDLLNTEN